MAVRKFSPEERAKRDAESKRRYAEKQRAKKIDPSAVKRSDAGRSIAEQKGGAAARPSGELRAASVEEATKRVQGTVEPAAPKPSKLATLLGTATDKRPPTEQEVLMVRSVMDPMNEPLKEIENDLAGMGLVGTKEEVLAGKKLVVQGKIPASEAELQNLGTCMAGTLVNFAPNLLIYMYPLGLMFGGLTFVGSRVVIFLRLQRAADEAKEAQKRADEAAQARSKFNPGAQAIAASNGAQSPTPEPQRTA